MLLPLRYSLLNLLARRARTLLTVAVIALVVLATTLFMGLISSLQQTLIASGNPRNLIVLRKGATNDGSSQLPLEAFQQMRYFEGIERDSDGQPLASPELVVQPFFRTRDGGRENVLVRGVEPIAARVHDVHVVEGRMFHPSSGEVVVGRRVARRYEGAQLGSELRFGRGVWKVVGIFESGGSAFESEVWADARQLAADAKRPYPYSGMRIRAAPATDIDALARRIADDPRWALEAKPELAYYAKQAESARPLYVIVLGLAVLSGIGALFGASNTLYAAVQARTAEIGTLRALGFPRRSILSSFLIESLLTSGLGFVLGTALAWAVGALMSNLLGGIAFGAVTFSTNIVELRIHPHDLLGAFLLSLFIGVFGGIAPAARAARLRPIDALHKA